MYHFDELRRTSRQTHKVHIKIKMLARPTKFANLTSQGKSIIQLEDKRDSVGFVDSGNNSLLEYFELFSRS